MFDALCKKGTLIQSMPSARDTCFGFLKIKIPYAALTRQTACVHNKENTESSRLGQQEKLKRGRDGENNHHDGCHCHFFSINFYRRIR